jgi:hypothetical protein
MPRASRELAYHRLELLLVIGRLHDIGRNHQQAVCRHRGLGVVTLIEAARATGMMRDCSSARLI